MDKQYKIQKLPVIGEKIKRIDDLVGSVGLPGATRKIVESTRSRLVVSGLSEELRILLMSDPCVVIGNHSRDTEPIPMLAALPDRKDVFLVGTSNFSVIGPNLTKQLLPVYIRREIRDRSGKLSARIGKYMQIGECPSEEECHRLNVEMINDAKREVEKGGLVVIFPEGPSGGKEWFNGVGYLVSGLIGSRVRFSLVFAHAGGVSGLDILRPVVGRLLPVLDVKFSDQTTVVGRMSGKDPKEITKGLHEGYVHWLKSLGQ